MGVGTRSYVKSLKSISWWLELPYFDVKKKSEQNDGIAIIQDWGCGVQGCYFQPNPRVISQIFASPECTDSVCMT